MPPSPPRQEPRFARLRYVHPPAGGRASLGGVPYGCQCCASDEAAVWLCRRFLYEERFFPLQRSAAAREHAPSRCAAPVTERGITVHRTGGSRGCPPGRFFAPFWRYKKGPAPGRGISSQSSKTKERSRSTPLFLHLMWKTYLAKKDSISAFFAALLPWAKLGLPPPRPESAAFISLTKARRSPPSSPMAYL